MFAGTPLTAFAPTADVYETPTGYVIELAVPGYEEDELAIEIADHMLIVTGKHEETTERTFKREFQLPVATNDEQVTTRFEHGVLEVHAPKIRLVVAVLEIRRIPAALAGDVLGGALWADEVARRFAVVE